MLTTANKSALYDYSGLDLTSQATSHADKNFTNNRDQNTSAISYALHLDLVSQQITVPPTYIHNEKGKTSREFTGSLASNEPQKLEETVAKGSQILTRNKISRPDGKC